MKAPLLIEIGCEEIPARMIPAAASDLAARTGAILDQAGLAHGAVSSWGGTRRLAVRIDDVEARQADRSEQVLGPPASAAFDAGGKPTSAAAGFARKQGVAPEALRRIETEKGVYAGFQRDVAGRSVGEVLASTFPAAVAAMAFPKTMRWGSGAHRWVRPVHWLLAIHGGDVLPIELFEVRAGGSSMGHRFLAQGAVKIADPGAYAGALRAAFVLADPDERRKALSRRLAEAAAAAGGELVEDASLLEEVVDLVEWPGVVAGRFDDRFLDLPREILVTTLRHHQKSFSVQRGYKLLPVFLSVANTDRDPAGHVRRGNEWVVSGRLEDARFFWDEDRRTPLSARLETLRRVTFHQKVGSYADKAERVANLAAEIARRVGLDDQRDIAVARDAGRLAKTDLVTGLVGEFPELQGIAGGLLLRGEGSDPAVADGVYEHYKPVGPEDGVPSSVTGAIVSLADKLDTVAALTAVGEAPTGSRDPFGLRRAANIHRQALLVGKSERAALKKQKPAILWFTGLSGAGKSTIANIVEQRLLASGHHTTLLDGDNVRHGLNRDLGFTGADRVENIRRVGEVAKLMGESGLIVLCSFISPYRAERDMVRALVGEGEFIEVFVDTPIADCIERDPKGLYAKAKAGRLKNFTGVDAPYEAPERPEVHLRTIGRTPEELASTVVNALHDLDSSL
jgi:glycyl-tRNA synthetase beta chain